MMMPVIFDAVCYRIGNTAQIRQIAYNHLLKLV